MAQQFITACKHMMLSLLRFLMDQMFKKQSLWFSQLWKQSKHLFVVAMNPLIGQSKGSQCGISCLDPHSTSFRDQVFLIWEFGLEIFSVNVMDYPKIIELGKLLTWVVWARHWSKVSNTVLLIPVDILDRPVLNDRPVLKDRPVFPILTINFFLLLQDNFYRLYFLTARCDKSLYSDCPIPA